jgi:hypothetical protein
MDYMLSFAYIQASKMLLLVYFYMVEPRSYTSWLWHDARPKI